MTIPDSEQCSPEEESRVIRELTKKAESNPREGDTCYLLSTRWYVSWQEYTGKPDNTPAERPGPIDNADLVSEAHDPQLLRTVEEGRNYVLLPEEAWGRLHEWYKGGPAIARKMITVGERKEFRVEVFPLCLHLIDSRNQSHSVIQLSRKASLNELYEAVCQLKGLEPDKVRIFDYFNRRKRNTLVASDQTLEDSNLGMDQHILLELQDDGSWPSRCFEMVSRPFRSSFSIAGGPSDVDVDVDMDMDGCEDERNVTRRDRRGLVGLQNLGNTCFMNTSLQCLAHTPPIVEYFLQDYGDEINRENPLGMRGDLALAFGDLLRKLWSGRGSVPPRAFKQKLAHFAPQFGGSSQHDSQELLAFLLDGLHEDLNRVKQKPYTETKDSDGRPDEEVADEYWSNHKARNDSIIVDVCQGQYKSTLVCPACSKTAITFDPFMYLSLPLPSKATRIMTVTVFSGDGSALPMQFTVTLPKHGSCKHLIEALATECCLGTDEYLLLAEVYMHEIYRYLEDSSELEDIKDDEFLVAYRLPKRCMNFTRLEIIHRFLQKPIFIHPRPFLTPLVTFLEDPQSSSDIDQAVARVLAPFSRPTAQNPNELISSGPDTGPEDMPTESSATGESSGSELSFHLRLMNNFAGCLPISRETPLKFGRLVKVALDWRERDHELYDDSYLGALPAVHKAQPNADDDTKPEAISLFSCLDAFLKEEALGPDDMWYCPGCKEHRQATKKLDLWRLPDVLVFHLKRFSYDRWMKNKLDILVDFPVRDLDLSDYVNSNEEGGDNVYELYAISNHYGGLGGGHYSAHCKLIHGDNKWYHFDDSQVSQVSEDDITTSAAYVLFYRRVASKNGTVAESVQS